MELECDSVIVAVGRGPNSFIGKLAGLKSGRKNGVAVDDHSITLLQAC
ncbi:MAG: hypothetical protein JRN59_08445 [Nitrososphaerota archaeon]|jgi:pyruvate/2-oxoglutarate dehydrogenase complex dihydrolipoamide dehydrogenase (E3) component|nr:hypothetical protein [Nitrososphaerota archaeon]